MLVPELALAPPQEREGAYEVPEVGAQHNNAQHPTMDSAEFRSYKQRFVRAIREALASEPSPALSEAAFPAYAHSNALVSFLFWERIRVVMRYLGDRPRRRVVDFGCGGGVMLPFLADRSNRVIAIDVDLTPLARLDSRLPLPSNVEVHDARRLELSDIPAGSVDVVLALDVLEHVSDLESTVEWLYRLLAPGGEIIVSGPTESLAYRIGRRIAGKAFTGQYHVRGVKEIKRAVAALGPVKTIATLFYPIPLFKLYSVTRPADGRGAGVSDNPVP
jgi:2-polyprenyl-3-methyl-5-hydroxy-6-metoxy-1,4-benzoquinol methylase